MTTVLKFKLKNGVEVLAKTAGYPQTYVNRTQAENAAKKLLGAGVSATVYNPANSRCIYIAL